MFERTTSEVRIDRSDGAFVDIMHTNGGNEDNGFLGINAAVGHADFFPNGGHNQAGCGPNNFICSHNEATKIWIDSVKAGVLDLIKYCSVIWAHFNCVIALKCVNFYMLIVRKPVKEWRL